MRKKTANFWNKKQNLIWLACYVGIKKFKTTLNNKEKNIAKAIAINGKYILLKFGSKIISPYWSVPITLAPEA